MENSLKWQIKEEMAAARVKGYELADKMNLTESGFSALFRKMTPEKAERIRQAIREVKEE